MALNNDLLRNYFDLVAKVDGLCNRIRSLFVDQISCRDGCDSCCRHLSLFPVEAYALASALAEAPPKLAGRIRNIAVYSSGDCCPLLEKGSCLLYEARPLICRTHGYPILTGRREMGRVDYCPRNFRGIDRFPAELIIDLDTLNTILAAVNTLFVSSIKGSELPENRRFTMADSLLLDPRQFP